MIDGESEHLAVFRILFFEEFLLALALAPQVFIAVFPVFLQLIE